LVQYHKLRVIKALSLHAFYLTSFFSLSFLHFPSNFPFLVALSYNFVFLKCPLFAVVLTFDNINTGYPCTQIREPALLGVRRKRIHSENRCYYAGISDKNSDRLFINEVSFSARSHLYRLRSII